jgi:hypothetical protein
MKNIISTPIKLLAKSLTAQPIQKKPNEIFADVRPLLREMGISDNLFTQRYTELEAGKIKEGNALYCLYVDRQNPITPDIIARLNRHKENVEELSWNQKSMTLKLWYPMGATPAPVTPGAPAPAPAPGAP